MEEQEQRKRRMCLREKYARMRKVGVPPHGVQSCMLLDGEDPHTFYLDCSRDDYDQHVMSPPPSSSTSSPSLFGTLWRAVSTVARKTSGMIPRFGRRDRSSDGAEDESDDDAISCPVAANTICSQAPFRRSTNEDDKHQHRCQHQQQQHVASLEEILDARSRLRATATK